MPEAWTNRDNLSDDGYLHPDTDGQCYISFKNFSPQIGNESRTFQEQMTDPAKYFIKYFYDHALRGNCSVGDALNLAAHDFFGDWYTSSILCNGYHAWWVGDERMVPPYDEPGWVEGKMRVFGDGNVCVFQPKITLTANHGLSPTFYVDGEPHSTGDIYVWPTKVYTISVSDVPGYEFHHFSYNGVNSGRPLGSVLYYSGTITAYYNPIQGDYEVSVGTWGLVNDYPVYKLAPPLYIDGDLVGSARDTYQVSEGYHTFAVDPVLPIAPPFAFWVFRFWKHNDHGHIYTIYQPEFGFDVDEDTTLVAAYDLWAVPW
jgi:hypothetical protein